MATYFGRRPDPRVQLHVRQPARLPEPKPSVAEPLSYPKESFAPIELAPEVQRHLKRVNYEGESPLQGRVNTIEGWEQWDMAQRLAFLRAFVKDTARDPAIAAKAANIVRMAGDGSRDHQAQWAALLKWVQRNILYVNEPNERIQSPQYTLTEKMGDCDDLGIALAALGESIRLPWRFVITGRSNRGQRVRYVDGTGPVPQNVVWTHIYLVVGWPPFQPTKWVFAEPTLDVPLGWDTIAGRKVQGRADMAGRELGGSAIAMGAPESKAAAALEEAEKDSGLWNAVQTKINWWQVAGVVSASVLSAVVVKGLVEPKFAKATKASKPAARVRNPSKKRKAKRGCSSCGR
jgi:transglutaminase-like putative cysteine protease